MRNKYQQIQAHFFELSLGLFAVWVLLSGQFEGKFLLIGLCSSLAIAYICYPLLNITNEKSGKVYFVFGLNYPKLFLYFFWLVKEIVKASFEVACLVFSPKMNYEPRMAYFSMPFENPMASVILAFSIILTPGTITVDVNDDGIFEVHALTKGMVEGLLEGTMQRKVAELFGETCEFTPMPEAETTHIPKEVC